MRHPRARGVVRSFVRSHFDFRAKRSERTETASHRVHARVVKRAPNNIYAPFFRSIFVPFASRGSELELELGRLPSAGVMFARARVPALYGFLSYETSPVRRAGWFGGARARIVSNRVQMSSPPPRVRVPWARSAYPSPRRRVSRRHRDQSRFQRSSTTTESPRARRRWVLDATLRGQLCMCKQLFTMTRRLYPQLDSGGKNLNPDPKKDIFTVHEPGIYIETGSQRTSFYTNT